MKTIIGILFSVFVIAQISVAQHEGHDHGKKAEAMKSMKDLGVLHADVKKQLNSLLASYFDIKNALVATDGKTASAKAGEFLKLLPSVGVDKLTADQKAFFSPLAEKMKTDAEHIRDTQEVGHQRDHFSSFSNTMFSIVSSLKLNTSTVYQQFCPMAFGNKGGYWLSDKSEILNPYFGNKMLKCGSVASTLEAGK